MRTAQVPDDFAAFVADHGPRLLRACLEIVGDDRLAQELHDDLLVAVARRWPRWPAPKRTRSALVWLERQVRRRSRGVGTGVAPAALDLTASLGFVQQPAPVEPAAAPLWARAIHSRRQWWGRLGLVTAAVLVVLALLPRMTPPDPLPKEIPVGVTVLPPISQLIAMGNTLYPLPTYLQLYPESVDELPSLTQAPLARAIMAAATADGRLVLVDVERDPTGGGLFLFLPPERRVLAHPLLAGARLLTTSLSPDGSTVALPREGDAVLVDVASGTVRTAAALPAWAEAERASTVDTPGLDNPPWLSACAGPGRSSYRFVVGSCDPGTPALPRDIGVASGAVAAVAVNGQYAGALVSTDGARLDVLGFHLAAHALVLVRTADVSAIISWEPYSGALDMGTLVTADATVSIADMMHLS